MVTLIYFDVRMPIPKDPSKNGNSWIKFNVLFSARLTAEHKGGTKKLLS